MKDEAQQFSLQGEGISVGYQQNIIIPKMDVQIPKGKITSIIGPNGCGKSTLLKAFSRMMPSGAVLLDGQAIATLPTVEVARKMAILPQSPQAPGGLTVEELVSYGRYPHQKGFGKLNEEDHRAIAWALEITHMAEFAQRGIDALSGGQRQRAWIAMALAQDTPLILLDEPTTYLDMAHQLDDLSSTKLEEIPTSAFYSCDSLRAITFPSTVKTIGQQAFYYNLSLESLKMPAALTSIYNNAFNECKKIRSIDLSATSLTKIESWFSNVDSLRTVKLPSTVIEIGESAFAGSPIEEINFPASLTTIGNYAFSGNRLKTVDLSATQFTTINNWFANNNKLRTVKLPETVTTLGENAFNNCYITGINFPSSLTTISNNALNYCQIDTLRLPATVTEIGNSAFRYAKFDCVEIPSTVTKINSNAFYDAEIRGSLNITPNAALAWADGTPFRCYGSEYITNEDGTSYNRYWHLPDVYWNSAAEFPRDKFGQIDNLYLPANGSVSNNNDIGYIFYNGLTKRIDIAYTNENRKYSFSVNKEMKTQMINYRKYFSTTSGYGEAAGWKTIVLPFDVKEISYERDGYNEKDTVALAPFGSKALETAGTLPFWLYELGTDGNYKAATEIKAHKAYLICMPNNDKYPSENNISGYVNFTTSDATNGVTLKPTAGALKRSKGTKFDFVPTYEGVMQHDTVYVLNENNSYYADDKTYQRGSVFIKNYSERYSSDPAVYPFEAYLVTNEGKTSVASAPMLYSIGGGDGTITGIEDIPFATPEKATKAYSRDGVLYINTNADRTINIYDVTGRTVRIIEAREGMNEVHGLDSGIYLLEGQKVVIGR